MRRRGRKPDSGRGDGRRRGYGHGAGYGVFATKLMPPGNGAIVPGLGYGDGMGVAGCGPLAKGEANEA